MNGATFKIEASKTVVAEAEKIMKMLEKVRSKKKLKTGATVAEAGGLSSVDGEDCLQSSHETMAMPNFCFKELRVPQSESDNAHVSLSVDV